MSNASPRKLIWTTLGTAVAAVVILLMVVYPAEFNKDPLGTGALLGIKGISQSTTSVVAPQDAGYRVHEISFPLSPFESIEYKYTMATGAGMIYSWSATGDVIHDLHSEPDVGGPEAAESFFAGRGTRGAGTYVAPFDGRHGWFWENRNPYDVTVSVRTAGFYTAGREYSDRSIRDDQIAGPPD